MKAGGILFTNQKAVAVVDRFTQTRIGAFLQRRFAEQFTKPSQTVFLLLAMGFLLSSVRHTVANYLWRSGACLIRHYTRFYAFLGGPFFCEMDGLWRAVIRQAVGQVPEGTPIRVRVYETVCKKSGEEIKPADTYRNGVGTASQEYRTLWPRSSLRYSRMPRRSFIPDKVPRSSLADCLWPATSRISCSPGLLGRCAPSAERVLHSPGTESFREEGSFGPPVRARRPLCLG